MTTTLSGFLTAIRHISAYEAATGSRFVWRGVADASWPLHSSLVRAYFTKHNLLPSEAQLRTAERALLEEARDWALDWHSAGGRLTALELLAALQHYGVPTRLLDFSFNPLTALWFAVEQLDNTTGRVFAIDISDRLVSREDAGRGDPWWFAQSSAAVTEWTARSWIWRPPPFEARMVRQEGCFLMGGIPTTTPARNARVSGSWRPLRAPEVRACMSVPFQLISYKQAVAAFVGQGLPGQPPKARAFTLRIGQKQTLRDELQRGFGYSHRSLFPDFPGFAEYGTSFG